MKSVLIKEIELINYRQFLKQKIVLNSEKDKNIVVIQGKNGFGKSNIFNAITWCFFGTEQHLKPDERSLPICNTAQFLKLGRGQSVETSVKVLLDTDQGMKEIARRIVTRKDASGQHFEDKSQLQITEQIGKNWKVTPYPEFIISRIVPKGMGHFFFIDGEKLRQLFENINPYVIKKSIFDLSQITLLQNAIDHFGGAKAALRREVRGDEPALDQYQEILERLSANIAADRELLAKQKKDRDDAYINKKRLDEELRNIDDKGVKVLEEQRKGLVSEIDGISKQLEEKKDDYLKRLFSLATPLVIKDSIEETLSIFSKLESKRKLPPKIERTFITELLETKHCICGRSLGRDAEEARKELEKLLKDDDYSAIAGKATELRYELKKMLTDSEKSTSVLKNFEDKIQELELLLEDKQKALAEVNVKIGNIDVEKARRAHEERQKYINALQTCNAQIGRLEENIRSDERRYKDAEILYKKEMEKKDAFKVTKEKINICDESIKLLDGIKEKIMKEIKHDIEAKTKEYWCKLISAKRFENISIQDDYELRVEKDGFNAVTSLSAAETLCLGYSFMSALRSASGFVVPIVIDTPLAKIDKEYRINVANWFKEVLFDAQVVLLVTDAEYAEGFKTAIQKHVAQEYLLKHDEKTSISEVIENG